MRSKFIDEWCKAPDPDATGPRPRSFDSLRAVVSRFAAEPTLARYAKASELHSQLRKGNLQCP
jgi:hypothetical protein